MNLSGLDLLLWAASFVGHSLLLGVLLYRRRSRDFPFFSGLIVLSVVRTITLYLVHRFANRREYFYTYWSLALVDEALQLAVVYEITSRTFRPTGRWARDMGWSLLAWGFGSSALAALLAFLAAPTTRLSIQAALMRVNLFSAALMSELFVGMMVLSVTRGLPWTTHAARIAQGLGVYSIVSIVFEAAHTYFGVWRNTHIYDTFSHARIMVYLACLLYWIVALWRDAPAPRTLTESMRHQLSSIRSETMRQLGVLQSRGHQ